MVISGKGVTARVVEYQRKLNPQEMQLLGEQRQRLKRGRSAKGAATPMMAEAPMMSDAMMAGTAHAGASSASAQADELGKLLARIEKRISEYVQR